MKMWLLKKKVFSNFIFSCLVEPLLPTYYNHNSCPSEDTHLHLNLFFVCTAFYFFPNNETFLLKSLSQ